MKKSNLKTKLLASITCLSFGFTGLANAGAHSEDVYGPFPVTLKGYSGDCTNTVSYSGQIARHVMHDSLKAASTKGSYDDMNAYYVGADGDMAILAPSSKDGFPIKQTLLKFGATKQNVDEILKNGKELENNSNQILDFTKEVKNMKEDDRIKIIETLWRIIYSNKEADIYETSLMRRLAGLLYIDSKIMGDIKNKIREENLK